MTSASPRFPSAQPRLALRLWAFVVVAFSVWFTGCSIQNPFSAYNPTAAASNRATANATTPAADTRDPARAAQLRTDLAAEYLRRGDMQGALREIDTALKAKPRFAPALSLQGLILAQMGDTSRADNSFRAALTDSPTDGDTMHNYGVFLCSQKRYQEAQTQFNSALAQPGYRSSGRTWLALGTCQKGAGDMVAALQSLSQAANLMPGDPITAYELADTLHVLGRESEARSWLSGLNAREGTISPASLELESRVAFALGDRNGAIELLRQLRQRFPDSPEAARYR